METFPDARSVALIRGVRPDLVLIDRGWLTPARAAALTAPEIGLRLVRVFPTHVVYRLDRAEARGPEALEATAALVPSRADARREVCVTLRNPGAEYVPLYPLRRLRLEVAGGSAPPAAERWLPLDFAPGATHTECVAAAGVGGSVEIRGTVEGAGPVHHFTARADGRPARMTP
jgi:hypothetical protein